MLLSCLRAPKSSSTPRRGITSTPPWKRLTTSGRRPSSEELDLELSTRSGAPRSTGASRRETALRLRERPSADDGAAPRPEGRDITPAKAVGPSRDSSSNLWAAALVRRPPRHPAGLRLSPWDLSADAIDTSAPRRTRWCRRRIRRGPADPSTDVWTPPRRPEGQLGGPSARVRAQELVTASLETVSHRSEERRDVARARL